MLKLPKEHLSVSQINLWESDPIAYQKKYFIGIPDPPSPFLEFGKQFAKDIEDYAAGVQRDFNFPVGFLDMTLIYPHVEYKLEHDFGDFKMLGFIDNMSKDYELVVDFNKFITDKEYEIEQMKKQMIADGLAEEHSKTVTLILVKDEREQ
jgi:hypothetical protein